MYDDDHRAHTTNITTTRRLYSSTTLHPAAHTKKNAYSLPPPPPGYPSHALSPLKAYDEIPPAIASLVEEIGSRQHPTLISLQDLIQKTQDITGNNSSSSGSPRTLTSHNHAVGGRLARRLAGERGLMEFGQLLKQELPIRLAHRIQDLDGIPKLRDMPSVQMVKGIYIHSFLALLEIENPVTPALEAEFGQLLQQLYQDHSDVLLQMAKGAWEFKSRMKKQQGGGDDDDDDDDDDDGKNATTSIVWFAQQEECHAFLNRFYSSRVGIRVLAGQYLAVRQQWQHQTQPRSSLRIVSNAGSNGNGNGNGNEDVSHLAPGNIRQQQQQQQQYIGMICQETSPYQILQSAIHDATRLCEAKFGVGQVPRVVVRGRLDLNFPYIPTHLHYILLELLKNALRATVEHYYETHPASNPDDDDNEDDDEDEPLSASPLSKYQKKLHPECMATATTTTTPPFPDVVVIIADNTENEDVVIKISDQGGGIPRSQTEHIWSYLYTTANPNIQKVFLHTTDDDDNDSGGDAPAAAAAAAGGGDAMVLAGLGYGLPMSRAYARYFAGDVDIISMEGYGTDAFVYLARLGDKAPRKLQV
jgi:pyruvate dehydrogenase kinase 2/3/4